jgi:hypothetical protein
MVVARGRQRIDTSTHRLVNDPTPTAAAKANIAQNAVLICLVLGAVALVSGCLVGFENPGNREIILALLGGGVALFVAALLLQLRRPGVPIGALSTSLRATPSLNAVVTRQPAPLQLPSRASADASPTEWPLAVLPASESKATAPTPPVVSRHAEVLPDVPALMRVPLSDLLLAALCKDPQGAHRIFAQIALQGDQTDVSAITSSGGTRPSNGEHK